MIRVILGEKLVEFILLFYTPLMNYIWSKESRKMFRKKKYMENMLQSFTEGGVMGIFICHPCASGSPVDMQIVLS